MAVVATGAVAEVSTAAAVAVSTAAIPVAAATMADLRSAAPVAARQEVHTHAAAHTGARVAIRREAGHGKGAAVTQMLRQDGIHFPAPEQEQAQAPARDRALHRLWHRLEDQAAGPGWAPLMKALPTDNGTPLEACAARLDRR
jgi:hypothetical protein